MPLRRPHQPIFRKRKIMGSVPPGNTPRRVGVIINQADGQDDPTVFSPIIFDAVFTEPVTGFTNADVTIGGTAGATTAVVSTSDDITWGVEISGMTGPGTVIATITAGVATAISDGAPNSASTSGDNTVTYTEPV